MKGLLKKDFLLLKSVVLPMIAILVMLIVSGLVEAFDIVYSSILWALVVIASTFNQDRFHRTEEFIASIPDGKVKAVKARYVMSLLLVIGLTVVVFAMAGINLLLHYNFAFDYVPIIILITIAYTLLGFSLFLPLTYRFGILKTSLLSGFWSVGGMFVLIFAAENQTYRLLNNYAINKIYLGCGLLIFAILCILYISYLISIKAYLKREK